MIFLLHFRRILRLKYHINIFQYYIFFNSEEECIFFFKIELTDVVQFWGNINKKKDLEILRVSEKMKLNRG